MLEEKDIDNEVIEVEHNNVTHFVEMKFLIELMESTTASEKKVIEKTMRQIDFKNGDMFHYMKHLAKGFIVKNY